MHATLTEPIQISCHTVFVFFGSHQGKDIIINFTVVADTWLDTPVVLIVHHQGMSKEVA